MSAEPLNAIIPDTDRRGDLLTAGFSKRVPRVDTLLAMITKYACLGSGRWEGYLGVAPTRRSDVHLVPENRVMSIDDSIWVAWVTHLWMDGWMMRKETGKVIEQHTSTSQTADLVLHTPYQPMKPHASLSLPSLSTSPQILRTLDGAELH